MVSTSTEQPDARRPATASREPSRDFDPSATAFFFDFDGTLAEIADEPGAVRVKSPVAGALARLAMASGGALAIVSGRDIRQIDGLLAPLRLPVAGVHGLERRDAGGNLHRLAVDEALAERVGVRIGALVARHPGLLREVKPGSVALHYRKRPELAGACLELAHQLAGEDERIQLQRGRKVVELKFARRNKADAIAEFMAEPPFSGRMPLFAGDDVTDEDGFAEVARHGGVAIKIGDGETAADFRFAGIAAFHGWLAAMAGMDDTEGTR
jgi:trehalose 6-phosphate phosphatase